MSEHITRTGAFEDAARLVQHAGILDETLDHSLMKYYDTALFATSARDQPVFQRGVRRTGINNLAQHLAPRLFAGNGNWAVCLAILSGVCD